MKFEIYRRLDLFIFTILLIFSSLSSVLLLKNSNHFYFSFSILILSILIYRWNYLAIIPYIFCQIFITIVEINIFQNNIILNFTANLGGCLLLFFLPLFFKKINKKNPTSFKLVLYLVLCYILVGMGKSLSLLAIGEYRFFSNFMFYIFRQEILSIVVSSILIIFLSKIDNLIVDVKLHLIDVQKKEEEKWKGIEISNLS